MYLCVLMWLGHLWFCLIVWIDVVLVDNDDFVMSCIAWLHNKYKTVSVSPRLFTVHGFYKKAVSTIMECSADYLE